ncbi:Metallo-dependent phosphatase-like protein [Bisporella sp. PMI_857]|nr:Metallo-dependent phosphatase-like protein [Bisporella sp. PMI_857]
MASQTTDAIKTRFLIISDTHNFQFEDPKSQGDGVTFKHPLPKADVLLHCGDLTMRGGLDAYKNVLKMLASIDAELKLIIAGNHDFSLDGEDWKRKKGKYAGNAREEHGKAIEIMTGPLAKEAGVTYLEEGTHTCTLKNGAKFTVYASPYQPEFWGAFQYRRDEDRFNTATQVAPGVTSIATNPVPDFPNVDIMMTHGPPSGILDMCFDGRAVGCENLLRAARRAKPKLYCFGHIHEAHGAKRVTWLESSGSSDDGVFKTGAKEQNPFPEALYKPAEFGMETLMVNAAIMNLMHSPLYTPWLVDLDLERT